ncbi:hypothetical protein I4U23_023089 [Adineta vaga]|nr:hypothetical protein I4U23_023089 [Adineta vaga]
MNSSDFKYFDSLLNIIVVNENYLLIGFEQMKFANACENCPLIVLVEIDSSTNAHVHSYEIIDLSEYEDINHQMLISTNNYNDIVISFQEINLIIFGHIDLNKKQIKINSKNILSDQFGQSFGHSILWINNTRQLAILSSNAPLTKFANSLIFFFNYEDDDLHVQNIFPNNQQKIAYDDEDEVPIFSNLININGNYLGIRLSYSNDNWYLLIIPLISLEGKQFFAFGDVMDDDLIYRFAKFDFCLPGMYKNSSNSLEPCAYCPVGEKTSKYGSFQCEKCEKTENCPLASLSDEIEYKNINQIVSYPSRSDSDSFDDIILSNIFHFQCLPISPTFWMFIIISITLLLLFVVFVCSFFPTTFRYRSKIHKILSHIDLITEGQFWLGGVASCGIFVLVIFALLFSFEYMNLYPIENFRQAVFSCDSDIINAKFTSGLQLLALPKTDEERPIFDLLDNQAFTLIFHLINTNLDCKCSKLNITQKNGDHFTSYPSFTCTKNDTNVTLTLSITLLTHVARTRIEINSFYPISSLQICLQGSNKTIENGKYELRSLFVCNVFSDLNHTISDIPDFDITLTKAINRTEPLDNNQSVKYSGLWIPLITGNDITTKTLLKSTDNYIRYLRFSTTISIRLLESQFFIQNTQQPIARRNEILFRNVLFLGVVIEIFSLTFLISKLLLLPISRLIYYYLFKLCVFHCFTCKEKRTNPSINYIEKTSV